MRILAQLRRGVIYLLPMTVLLVAIGARLVAPDLLDRLSLIAFDLYQRAAPRQPGNAPIRIIDIDDKSLNKIGQWPWPRTIVAKMVDRLAAAGAAVIAFDIDFAEPDRTSPKMLLPLIAQNGVGAADAEKLLAALPDPDQALAASIKKIPVATGFILTDDGESRPPAEKAGFAMSGTDPLGHVEEFPQSGAKPAGDRSRRCRQWLSKPIPRLGSRRAPGAVDPDTDHQAQSLRAGGHALSIARRRSAAARLWRIDLYPARVRRQRREKLRPGYRAHRDPHRPGDGADRRRRPGMAALCGAHDPASLHLGG